MSLKEKYYAPTPVKFRKIGDAILFFCTGCTPIVASLPLTDATIIWLNIGLSLAGLAAKTVTNFFIE